MRAVERVHRGTHDTRGLIVDPRTVGGAVARQRVLAHWRSGAKLHELPDGNWLLLFPSRQSLDSVAAGGSLVVENGDGLIAAPLLEVAENELAWWSEGALCRTKLGELATIDPSQWVQLGIPVHALVPLEAPEPVGVVEPAPPRPQLDLRRAANVSEISEGARRLTREVQAGRGIGPRRSTGSYRGPGTRRSHLSGGKGILARLALRSPLRHEIGRRHAKYLDRLSDRFTGGDLNEALRHAIPLGGLGNAALSLRLPGRRDSLSLTAGQPHGKAVPFGPTIRQYLEALYRQAAKELEESGRIAEAAFVLSELLNNVGECVALLERHRRYETAATLAEDRSLEPAMTVRLWWLAGDRVRAMRLARKSHAYPSVLKHLVDSAPEVAHEFRLLWVDELERSGNTHGAIAVGWPDPRIRPLLINVIERGVAADNEWSLGLQAYRVALNPSVQNRSTFYEAMSGTKASLSALRFMAEALSQAEPADPVADREVCSAATRILVSVRVPRNDRTLATALKKIRNRADPILAADLPARIGPSSEAGGINIPPQPPGALAPLDVVPISDDRVLIALGEDGLRLSSLDGRTVAHWGTPCHHLVPADHGQSVLLLGDRDTVFETHILDLVTRKTRYYGAIRTTLWARTFDGASWAALDARGIVFYDMLADRPQVAWRELEPSWTCHAMERSPSSLAVLVGIPANNVFPHARSELWRWDLPRMRLDQKKRIEPVEHAVRVHLLSDATSIWEREGEGLLDPVVLRPASHGHGDQLRSAVAVRSSGELLAVQNEEQVVCISVGHDGATVAEWECGEGEWGFRAQGTRLAIWASSGTVAVVDTERPGLLGLTSIS